MERRTPTPANPCQSALPESTPAPFRSDPFPTASVLQAVLRSRIYFIASPVNARRLIHFDDDDRSLLLLSKWAPLQVSEYEPFLKENYRFLIYGSPSDGWLLPKFLEEQVSIQAGKRVGENMIMLVNARTPLAVDRPSDN